MEGHEFPFLLCKYFSTVTVLLYLPHLFVYMYFVIWEGFIWGGGGMENNAIFYFIFLILVMAYVQ